MKHKYINYNAPGFYKHRNGKIVVPIP